MKTKYHFLNLIGIIIVAFIIAVIQNGGFLNTLNSGVAFLIGTMIVPIAPAAIVLLIGLIIRAFKKSNWKKIYIVAWSLFLIINIISIIGNLMLKS